MPFRLSTQFKYFGININKNFTDLYKENFRKLLHAITEDLQGLSNIPITLAGRINIVKMNIVPKFLFFSVHSIYIKKGFFHSLDKIITEFIWNRKKRRLRMIFLQRPKSVGGMGLPNFKFYYWASNIKMMTYWLQNKKPLLRFCIENACHPSSLPSMLLSALPTVDPDPLTNPVVSHLLKIWFQIQTFYAWQSCSLRSPLINNHAFAPSFTITVIKDWFEKGIHSFLDVFIDQIFPI